VPEQVPDTPARAPRVQRAIVLGVLFFALLTAGGWWAGRDTSAPAAPAPKVTRNGARLLDQVLNAVALRFVDSLSADSIYGKAVAGLLRELNDPYTTFLREDRLRRLNEQMTGTYSGVGLQVDIRDGYPTVIEPVPGGPSHRAGLVAGDRLVRIGGESAKGWTQQEASRALRGAPGSTVVFDVERGDQRLVVTVEREAVHVRAVQRATLLENMVGYVDVNVFNQSTASELVLAVDSLIMRGARSLMVDLRGNPGGLLEQGVGVAELFLDRGQSIVQLRGRPGQAPQTIVDTFPQRWPAMPVAVLIDRGSASASEIVAGALQDHDRALVVGVTSFGKGSAQHVYPLVSGGALRLTTARWYTPVGRSISKPRPPEPNEDGDLIVPRAADTLRPRFRTDAGRMVLGGGGITPDVEVGDSITPIPVQLLARAMGPRLRDYRDALAREALASRRQMRAPTDPVTSEMLDRVYRALEARKVAPDRRIFDAAAPWVSRSLGYEMTRVAFGPDAEFLRRAQDDPVITKASDALQKARLPAQVFAAVAPTITSDSAPR
jgi:carboxyl-terminal processing protease